MSGYPVDRLYEEMTFLAYYLHWPCAELMGLEHARRVRFCHEVTAVNRKLNGETQRKNVFEIGGGAP